MNNQNFFYIVQDNSQLWMVIGPVRTVKFIGKDEVEMSNGQIVKIKTTYHTKGGACKECHKRNYLVRAEGGVK